MDAIIEGELINIFNDIKKVALYDIKTDSKKARSSVLNIVALADEGLEVIREGAK